MIARALLVAAAVSASAAPASAQSLLERAARGASQAAAEGAAREAVAGLFGSRERPVAREAETDAPGGADAPAAEAPAADAPAVAAFADPAPVNYSPSLPGPYRLQFAPELQAAERAFDEFNAVPCDDCEGGRSYDSWIRHHVREVQPMRALENRVGEMAVGEAIRWTGVSGARLALTVIGDAPVGAWPCKQVRWSSERDSRSAERLGLFCHGKRGDYLGDGWVEVL
ncbi:hypothetical protein [Brevundimonas sp.]|uniref:hypothetical protein n=1 Tax=Brevundimonas sp. TaxID=1871086 RepID=UPI0035B2E17B